MDGNAQRVAQSNLDQQHKNYAASIAPTTAQGKQAAHDTKLLAGYRGMLRDADRDPLGPKPQRIARYKEVIADLEIKMGLDKTQATFEGSKGYQQAVEHAANVRALAPDDMMAQNLVNIAFESLSQHKDTSRFKLEIASVIEDAESREQVRVADANIASITANIALAKADRDAAQLEHDTAMKLYAVKDGASE